ncbi:MAG TPA: SGNH/GDSL hydrolase family protein [Xanthobacteraceae bacterium]|nr:SGNH/GDSL hydrolase family protein [Xanthobacteraceae bacterium]
MHKRWITAAVAFASLFPILPSQTQAQTAPASAPVCAAPEEFTHLDQPLRRTALALAAGGPVVIVAVGSSSTAGAGATTPARSYPAQLEAELRARFPASSITVINSGANGEVARQMLARFEETVLQAKPHLVLWQVGTNAVLHDHLVTGEAPLLHEGIRRLKAAQTDIVLIDSQYAPKVLAKPNIFGMLALLAKTAREEQIGLFQRFAVMRHWVEVDRVPFETLLSPDGLHMNDWSYGCIARLIANALVQAVRHPAIAHAPARRR